MADIFKTTGADLRAQRMKELAKAQPTFRGEGTPSEQFKQQIGFGIGGALSNILSKKQIERDVQAQEDANASLIEGYDLSTVEGLTSAAKGLANSNPDMAAELVTRARSLQELTKEGDVRTVSKNSENELQATMQGFLGTGEETNALLVEILGRDDGDIQKSRLGLLNSIATTRYKEIQQEIFDKSGEQVTITTIQGIANNSLISESSGVLGDSGWFFAEGEIDINKGREALKDMNKTVMSALGLRGKQKTPIESTGATTGTGLGNPDNAVPVAPTDLEADKVAQVGEALERPTHAEFTALESPRIAKMQRAVDAIKDPQKKQKAGVKLAKAKADEASNRAVASRRTEILQALKSPDIDAQEKNNLTLELTRLKRLN